MAAKVADFGLSRESAENKEYYTSKGGVLPLRWTAPEALELRKFSEKSDVWSFGVLLYEMWTRAALPYNGMTNDKVWVKVMEGYRLPHPLGCPMEVYSVMRQCWQGAGDRPGFAELRKSLEDLLNSRLKFNVLIPSNSEITQGGKIDLAIQRRKSNSSCITYDLPDRNPSAPRDLCDSMTPSQTNQTRSNATHFIAAAPRIKSTPDTILFTESPSAYGPELVKSAVGHLPMQGGKTIIEHSEEYSLGISYSSNQESNDRDSIETCLRFTYLI